MLKSALVGVLMTGAMSVAAQDTLIVQGSSPDLYLTHTVKKGETWYSLGRAYGLSPKDIAARNKMQMDQGLSLGKQVTIPLNKNNFVQAKNAGSGVRPVYHRVIEKETLYRIHVKYGKVPLENVREWNHFSGDGVQKDAYLVVGYVKGNGQSVILPSATKSAPDVAASTPKPSQPAAPETKPVPTSQSAAPETPPAAKSQPAAPETRPSQSVEPEIKPVAKTQSAEPETKPVERETPVTTSVGRTPSIPEGGFEQQYLQQTNNGRDIVGEKGPGSWFKSNAVIGSGKYYALHNTAPRGTIVKVTNPLTGRSIYAKVLDAIPQLKANANLIIKLSDAAQDALGITEPRFYCELAYDEK
ncbi:LysM peptidoglycan-binding domain-containing protein [Chitinophaga sp. GCM10012297]|uniref:LysM peptidoglycan-binding domain-containing protein n=1 Tax=Chitinophaga chungangae TaxID=2821488 RepID=A0ABS3Y917_9BACT|nr:LysM peptidoglycan-binding domain-containing protein [Chitinophaga chungangae]MBO9151173.1 LysM peptidoglycan-binding domain-containing protein [Chitinophaga chungangae]